MIVDLGATMRVSSTGGKKIVATEWMQIGVKFAQATGADLVDEDDE